jgi:hypothetical protein
MAGYDYRVRTAYEADDKQTGVIKKISAASKELGGALDHAAARAGGFALSLAAVGAAGAGALAVAALKTGLIDVNAKLEDANIGFATIFNMLGKTGVPQGLVLAKGLIAGIREDAKRLPGEFGDFVGMAQTITAPLLNAGKGVEDIRDLTRDTVVATAALLGSDAAHMQQGAREMAMLLEGHAGGHNVLGTRLGINAHTKIGGKDFAKAGAKERFDFITKALQGAKDSLPAFEKSWSGLTSTMVDGAKQLMGSATAPLFERIKLDLHRINDALDTPKAQRFADSIGTGLVWGYEHLVRATDYVFDHWSNITHLAADIGHELRDAWKTIEPFAKRIGQEMAHPVTAMEKLIVARGALGAVSGGGGMLSTILGQSVAAKLAGAGKGVVAGESAAASALSNVSALGVAGGIDRETDMAFHVASGGGLFSGPTGMALPAAAEGAEVSMLAAAGAAGALAIVLLAVVGALDVVTGASKDTSAFFHSMAVIGGEVWRDIKSNFGSAISETTQYLRDLWTAIHPLVDVLGVMLLGAIDGAIYAFRMLTFPMRTLASAIAWVVGKIPGFGTGGGDVADPASQEVTTGAAASSLADAMAAAANKPLREVKAIDKSGLEAELKAMDDLHANAKHLKGAGKVNITNQNYFTVMQENDPERFATNVATHLDKIMRSPRKGIGISTYMQH